MGRGSESNTAIMPISGVKSTDKINAQPKPILRRLPKNPTNTSSNRPDTRAKITIEDTILFSFPFSVFRFLFHTIVCSKWKILAGSISEVQLAKLLLCRCAEHLVHKCACDGRR